MTSGNYSRANDLYAAGDYSAALAAYEELASAGDPYCLIVAARMHAEGQGTQKDLNKARDYLNSAAGLGNVEACLQLAFVEKELGNDTAYFAALKRAADGGSLPALHRLGYCMLNGVGTRMDAAKGWEAITSAAKRGHLAARVAVAKQLLRRPWDVVNFLRGSWEFVSAVLLASRLVFTHPDDDRVR